MQPSLRRRTSLGTISAVSRHAAIILAQTSAGQAAALGLERLPALEFGEQQRLDLLQTLAIGTDLRRALQVVIRRAHAGGDGRLLPLQRLDLRGEGSQLPLLFVAEACARLGLDRCFGAGCGAHRFAAASAAGAGRCRSQSL